MTCKKLFLVTFLVLWMGVSSVPTVTGNTKRGVCPKSVASIKSMASCDNCSNDIECSDNMKCCNTGCGRQCVNAERLGFCSLNDLPVKEGVTENPKCFSDFDCPKNTKCCERGPSKDCMLLLDEKPGKCPDVCEPKSDLKCSTDRDCPDNLKCCPHCNQTCAVPVKVTSAVPSK